MSRRRVLVAGAGIGGLAAGIGLARAGWEVVVHERAAAPRGSGAGLSLFSNGFTALDVVGLGDRVRALCRLDADGLRAGYRTPQGRWLTRLESRGPLEVGVVHREALHAVLLDALATAGAELRCGTEVVAVADDGRGVTLRSGGRRWTDRADVVVAADGLRSRVRSSWPGDPGVRYAGCSSWRGLTGRPVDLRGTAGETWGRGLRFGAAPLADGRVYWYGVVTTPEGHRFPDEHAALRARFGRWHEPIPELLDTTSPGGVDRIDIHDLAGPVPTFRRGRCVLLGDAAHAMTPDLGQGGGQALEDAATLTRLLAGADGTDGALDAALSGYDRLRRPRTTAIAAQARRVGRFAQTGGPVTTALRDLTLRLTPTAVAAAGMRRVHAWTPPAAPAADGRAPLP